MADARATLSDGTKAPALSLWLVDVMLVIGMAVLGGMVWVVGYVFGFFYRTAQDVRVFP